MAEWLQHMRHAECFRRAALPAVLLLSLCACARKDVRQVETLRIGYQKWSTFSILRQSAQFADALAQKGIKPEWIEVTAGPPLFEALNAGSIDLGHSGDSPPLFAQAANIPFVYFAVSSSSPDSSAILVRNDSGITRASDLRGRRIGFTRGSSAHTLVLRYLEKNGLSLSDINAVFLPPADGRAALESGSIDAWAIWDPYFAAAQQGGKYRVLTSGRGYVDGREFYFASRRLAEQNPAMVKDFLVELQKMKQWAKTNRKKVNQLLAADTGMSLQTVALAESRRNRYGTDLLTGDALASEQALADRYFQLGLLPRKVDVKSTVIDLAEVKAQ
jgi:sulfonate transport system substrate-binding protein